MTQSRFTFAVGAVVACALVSAIVVLTWHGSIDGQAAVAFLSMVAAGFIGAGAHQAGTQSGAAAAAAPAVDQQQLASDVAHRVQLLSAMERETVKTTARPRAASHED